MIGPLQIEIAFSQFVQSFSNPGLDFFFNTVTILGDSAIWLLLIAFFHWNGEWKKAVFLGGSILLAYAIVSPLKEILARTRPALPQITPRIPINGYSMPSGHATTIAGILGYLWHKPGKWERFFGVGIVALVMLSRIYLGVHYLADVITGAFIGFAIGYAINFGSRKIPERYFTSQKYPGAFAILGFFSILAAGIAVFKNTPATIALAGFFCSVLLLKLTKYEPAASTGENMLAKQATGFAGAGVIIYAGSANAFTTISFLAAGVWAGLVFPLLWNEFEKRRVKGGKK